MDFGQLITSRQNSTVKRICALDDKKKRYAERLFRFDGIKLFCEAVECGADIEYVVLCADAGEPVRDRILTAIESGALSRESLLYVSSAVFEKMSTERAPEGIITVARFFEGIHRRVQAEDYRALSDIRLLIAQSLRDAGNLGTVIRSCEALGIDRLIITDDCADIYNSKTIRAAMGGLFRLKIDIISSDGICDAIRALRQGGRSVYAAALHKRALTVGEFNLKSGDCFVIGNEGHGLSDECIDACDGCAVIPMKQGSESLNAAAAAAICIWETVRASR